MGREERASGKVLYYSYKRGSTLPVSENFRGTSAGGEGRKARGRIIQPRIVPSADLSAVSQLEGTGYDRTEVRKSGSSR